ncbi:MAG: hypothetical protein GX776_02140 [Oxalobacter sp.]|nr:hypothetical protein [Oxalobacter sp.]
MIEVSDRFTELAVLLRERQNKEAEVRELDRRIFSLLGIDAKEERKRKPLSAAAMRVACGL